MFINIDKIKYPKVIYKPSLLIMGACNLWGAFIIMLHYMILSNTYDTEMIYFLLWVLVGFGMMAYFILLLCFFIKKHNNIIIGSIIALSILLGLANIYMDFDFVMNSFLNNSFVDCLVDTNLLQVILLIILPFFFSIALYAYTVAYDKSNFPK
mgnify:CR=1 FL=1